MEAKQSKSDYFLLQITIQIKKSVIYLQSKALIRFGLISPTLMYTLFIIIVHISLNSHKYLQEKRILFVEKAK